MITEQICSKAIDVIEIQAEMIASLKNRIDENFSNACEFLLNCSGKIVVTGVGKSGHIGKKIAATLASTGSPAFFIHPSEAKHGDIGMISQNDAVLALSNSGESEEIIDILPSLKRLGVPIIAITSKPNSTLSQAATVNINIAVSKEACPLGLAPTSSTTATLVMGDAIAMVLLDKKGFTQNDFALSHPGGSLGKRLLLSVESLMHKGQQIPSVSEDAKLKEALVEMTRKKLGMTTIVNQAGELVGIFTDGDLRRTLDENRDLTTTSISDVMTLNPKTIPAILLAVDALEEMEAHQITSLVVADDNRKPVGVVHIHDLLRAGVA